MAEPIQLSFSFERKTITAERARELLNYDPETGKFSWTKMAISESRGKRKPKIGSLSTQGHLQVYLDGKFYQLHRIAWLMIYGRWPCGDIDHINMCKTDNRLANLREATRSQNRANTQAHKDGSLGIKGVHVRENGKFRATITKNYRQINIGTFATKEEAAAAYAIKARELFGEFARS